MADLNEIQSASATKLVGSDASGQEQTPVQSTSSGGLHTNLRDAAGAEEGVIANGLKVSPSRDNLIAEITSATPLGVGGVFTSSTADLSLVSGQEITFTVFTNVASAALGFQIQWSPDGSNFDIVESYTIPAMSAGQGKTFTQRKVSRFLRVVYTNGAVAQATFRLNAMLQPFAAKHSSHRIGTAIDDDNDSTLVKANLVGRTAAGNHQNLKSTLQNNLTVVDGVATGGLQGALSVSTSAVEVKVGASRLANRKVITLYNNSIRTLYWGWTNAVTSSSGTPIAPGDFVQWDTEDDTATIFIIAAAGTNDTRVTEAA